MFISNLGKYFEEKKLCACYPSQTLSGKAYITIQIICAAIHKPTDKPTKIKEEKKANLERFFYIQQTKEYQVKAGVHKYLR